MKTRTWCLLILLAWLPAAWAFAPFEIKQIRLQGLERIAESTVFNYLPLKEGDTLTPQRAAAAIRALFKTGFFNDIELTREDDGILVIVLSERPSIAKIDIEGNEEIPAEELDAALKKIGFAEGRVFNRSLLERVKLELERQYFAQGKYGVKITSKVEPRARNRVAIDIDIVEGDVARIRSINIVGNQAFDDATLLAEFQSETFEQWDTFTSGSQYSKPKLAADLETLRSYYMNRGYINFGIDSTQVTISPDKREVFVTINISEGSEHRVDKIALSGNLVVDEAELRELIDLQPGDVFSRQKVTESSTRISERLGEEGYAFANVNPIPEIDEERKTVSLTFFVDPGKRVYVRRVQFVGNIKTHDNVLRREMRQLEGGWISTSKLNRSKVRLQRTGYFDEVNIETPSVPGRPDLVDVVFSVTERSSGSISASLGYGQGSGMIVAASINQSNFLGTGNKVSAEVNNSQFNRIYSFSLTDPYYTIDGISRGFRVYLRETNASAITSVAAYSTDVYGASVNLGIPLSEYRTARLGLGYDNTYLRLSSRSPQTYKDFADANGYRYGTYTITAGWSYDSRDNIVFPESGIYTSINADIALPGGDLTYYKASLRQRVYVPLVKHLVAFGELFYGHGDGYGDTTGLPFYQNYFAGGVLQNVRGFRDYSLGPRDPVTGNRLGGARKLTGSAELVFPPPMALDSKSVRMSAFVDAGNVFGNDQAVELGQLRASYGVSLIWISPVGALRFSWALPLRSQPEDITQRFQFSIGTPF